ncbi:MAG: insulinase family protein [Thermotogae bacterium]|jgi:predicted Zn-dependent peptidase|nr:insulinase family protein [Thermotogota bacterium]MCL5031751.1 insulinase family protein [Thermotogota bacterium]
MIREDGITVGKTKDRIMIDKLENGVLMVFKDIPSLRTITIGMGVKVGSINEKNGEFGISHLIEHSVFKGTVNFTASDLKRSVERYGGIINAFTSEEYTLFETKVPDFATKDAFNVLFDLVTKPLFPLKEIESEKRVVLEEIAMYEDDPVALSEENLLKMIWGDSPYGRPIAGKSETVMAINTEQIKDFFEKHYLARNIVIVIIGNLASVDLKHITKKMNEIKDGRVETLHLEPIPLDPSTTIVEKKDLNQINVSMGIPTVKRSDKINYSLSITSTILGSGMSSILFDRLREKLGLVYSISSSNQSHTFCGEFTINFSTSVKNLLKAIKEVKNVLNELPEEIEKQLEYGKKKVQGRLLMSTESTLATMYMMVDDYFTIGKIRGIDEITDEIEKVKESDIFEIFDKYMKREWMLSFVGPSGLKGILKDCEFLVDHGGS